MLMKYAILVLYNKNILRLTFFKYIKEFTNELWQHGKKREKRKGERIAELATVTLSPWFQHCHQLISVTLLNVISDGIGRYIFKRFYKHRNYMLDS